MDELQNIVPESAKGLILREKSIFERSVPDRKGFQLPPLDVPRRAPIHYSRKEAAKLPEVGELEVVRHFTRLSSWNYAIDLGSFPLGSCTMKYNPRINEEIALLSGLSEIHPESPAALCQGALEVIYRVEKMLCDISGLDECSVQPAAGAHGELTGLLLIRAFHEHHGSSRKLVLIPDSAHGTNPASCVLAGYQAVTLKSDSNGVLPTEAVKDAIEKYGRDIAALMVTNPNTAGIFESNIVDISALIHEIGAQMYMDGANMNAILGVAKPRDMGIDVMQYNLHKTFSTPHGGGGPGSGPVAVKKHLACYLPGPRVRLKGEEFVLDSPAESIGKVKGAFGNFGVIVRALVYILSNGSDGLKRVSRAAVLNANYLKHLLREYYQLGFSTPSFHECLFSDERQQKKYGVKTLQIAKALIDEGYAPPTIYFPLVVAGSMLIEPTETESIHELDRLAAAFIRIAKAIESGEKFEHAPQKTIVERVDEVGAARRLILSLDDRSS